jgi:Rrf2 family protein
MFSVHRQTDYAVRIVLHLACQDQGTRVSIAGMAKARHLPVPFVRRIVSRLAEAGLVKTVRGAGGGVSLADFSQHLTLWDVVEAMEGPICPSPCHAESRHCPLSSECPVRDVWTTSARVLENHLRTVLISELANASGHKVAHRPPSDSSRLLHPV